jgi:hypothetical protein
LNEKADKGFDGLDVERTQCGQLARVKSRFISLWRIYPVK